MAVYTAAAGAGLFSAGASWVGGVKPPSGGGHSLIIPVTATITYDEANGEYGDETVTAIQVAGTFKASRVVSTKLTVRGELKNSATTAVFDWGIPGGSIIPAGVIAELVVNKANTSPANGKYGWLWGISSGFTMAGAPKKRKTTIPGGVAVAATSIVVTDATGWLVGDALVLEATTPLTPRSYERVVVSSVAGTTIGISAATVAHAAGCRVINLTSNVRVYANTFNVTGGIQVTYGSPMAVGSVAIDNVEINCGTHASSANRRGGLCLVSSGASATKYLGVVSNCSFHNYYIPTGAPMGVSNYGLTISTDASRPEVTDCVWAQTGGNNPLQFEFGATVDVIRPTCLAGAGDFVSSNQSQGGQNCRIYDGIISGVTSGGIYSLSVTLAPEFHNCEIDNCLRIASIQGGSSMLFDACEIGMKYGISTATGGVMFQTVSSISQLDMNNCNIGTISKIVDDNISQSLGAAYVRVTNKNADITQQEKYTNSGYILRDNSIIYRGASSLNFQPRVAARSHGESYPIPGSAGVPITLKGFLRFDATYGTATPPTVTISGLGTFAAFTAPAVADTWHAFTLTVTPATTGDLTLTTAGTSAATTGDYWLDGVAVAPWITSTRHYGYLPSSSASPGQTVDPNITQSVEATVAAYTDVDSQPKGFDSLSLWACLNQTEAIFYSQIANVLSVGSKNIILDPAAAAPLIVTSTDVTFKSAVFTGNKITTTGTVTYQPGATADCIVESSAGTTGIATVQNHVAGSSLLVLNEVGAQVFNGTITGATKIPIPAGVTGSWTFVIRKYGKNDISFSLAVTGGGYFTVDGTQTTDTGITQPTEAMVAAYTTCNTPDAAYDLLALYGTTPAGIIYPRLAAKNGSQCDFGTLKEAISDIAVAPIAFNGTDTITIKSSAFVPGVTYQSTRATGAPLSLLGSATTTVQYTDSLGLFVPLTTDGIIPGSNVQFKNMTVSSVIGATIEAGTTSFRFYAYAGPETIRLRAMAPVGATAYYLVEAVGVMTPNGLSFLVSPQANTVYNGNGYDGTAVAGVTWNVGAVDIDLAGISSIGWKKIYASYCAEIFTDDGIETFANLVAAPDDLTYVFDASIVFKNVGVGSILVGGDAYGYRADGGSLIGSDGIQMFSGKAYAAQSAEIMKILRNTNLIPALL